MTNQEAFAQPNATAKIFGGMTRTIASSAERVDRDMQALGDSPAAFAISRKLDVGEAGRLLVSAGCVSPIDPRAIAMQQTPLKEDVDAYKTPDGLKSGAAKVVEQLDGHNLGREGTLILSGLRRSLKENSQISHSGVADAFGRIASCAFWKSSIEATDIAAGAFTTATQAGVEVSREKVLSKAKTGPER
jgi:hypothetical protein